MEATYKHNHLYQIALINAHDAIQVFKTTPSLTKALEIKCKWLRRRRVFKIIRNNHAGSRSIATTIVMCGFTLEAFINFYAIINRLDISGQYDAWHKPVYKWEKYPLYVTGNGLPPEIIDKVKKVFWDRNEIAHFKPQMGSGSIQSFSLADSLNNINMIHEIFSELKKLDNNVTFKTKTIDIPLNADNFKMDQKVDVI